MDAMEEKVVEKLKDLSRLGTCGVDLSQSKLPLDTDSSTSPGLNILRVGLTCTWSSNLPVDTYRLSHTGVLAISSVFPLNPETAFGTYSNSLVRILRTMPCSPKLQQSLRVIVSSVDSSLRPETVRSLLSSEGCRSAANFGSGQGLTDTVQRVDYFHQVRRSVEGMN